MRIKSYFAGTVEAAMDLARRELGEEAVLLESRPAPPEARHLGVHEVVFGVESPAPAAQVVPARGESAGSNAEVRAALSRIERALGSLLMAPAPAGGRGQAPLIRYLTGLGYTEPFAQVISSRACSLLELGVDADPVFDEGSTEAGGGAAAGIFREPAGRLATELLERGDGARAVLAAFGECCPAGAAPAEPRVMAFIGPPGGGRTSLLAKIAARAAAIDCRPTTILTTDTLRIGATDQLRSYAGIMGAAFEVHETPKSLVRAIQDHSPRSLVLIDTPGWSPAQLSDPGSGAVPWLNAFGSAGLVCERHLVLPAHFSAEDFTLAATRFAGFAPSHLALTRLDECARAAAAVSFACTCGLELSWLSFGQSVPEDVERATRARWLDLALCFGDEAGAAPGGRVEAREVAHA